MDTAQTVLRQGAQTQQLTTIATNIVPWVIGGVVVIVAILLLTRKD